MDKYSINVIWSEQDESFMATCPEFPGLSAFGDTREEAIREAQVALQLFIEDYQDDGETLPEPRRVQEYSGQTRLRMPTWLHRRLANEAERQGTSLNQLAVSYLSHGVGQSDAFRKQREAVMRAMQSYMQGGLERSFTLVVQSGSHRLEEDGPQDDLLRSIRRERQPATGTTNVETEE